MLKPEQKWHPSDHLEIAQHQYYSLLLLVRSNGGSIASHMNWLERQVLRAKHHKSITDVDHAVHLIEAMKKAMQDVLKYLISKRINSLKIPEHCKGVKG